MINEISEKYKKYLIEIRLEGKRSLFVSGMDISNEDNDFLLLDGHKKLLTFNNFTQISNYVLEEKSILDKDNFFSWCRGLKDSNPYVSYDLDRILKFLQSSNTLENLDKSILSQTLDFINIIGDYSYQVNDKRLTKLLEGKAIDHFKELYMNNFVWKRNEDEAEIKKDSTVSDFSYNEFKSDFRTLLSLFVHNFAVYSK